MQLGDFQKCFHRSSHSPVFALATSTPLCLFDDNILASLILQATVSSGLDLAYRILQCQPLREWKFTSMTSGQL